MRRLFIATSLVLIVGCTPKLNDEKSFEVDATSGGKLYDIPAVKADQKVTVTATAEGGPIDVYLYLSKNQDAVEKEIFALKYDKILDKSEKTQSATLSATIPAREQATVWLKASTTAKAKGKVKMTN